MALGRHPSRCPKLDDADLLFLCAINWFDLIWRHLLAIRPNSSPYLCLIHTNLDRVKWMTSLPFLKRKDVVFTSFDLGDMILTSDGEYILSGVTIPTNQLYEGPLPELQQPRRFFASFQGRCSQHGYFGSSKARIELRRMVEADLNPRYSYDFQDTSHIKKYNNREEYYKKINESSFGMVPHGDGRWSYRLIEVMGAGAIPVIIADGLTLPFEQFINYDQICIRIPEQKLKTFSTFSELLDMLPQDEEWIRETRIKIREIYELFFSSEKVRIDMMLRAAKYHQQKRS